MWTGMLIFDDDGNVTQVRLQYNTKPEDAHDDRNPILFTDSKAMLEFVIAIQDLD